MGKINEKIKELTGPFVPMSLVSPNTEGTFSFKEDEVEAFDAENYTPDEVPRGKFVTDNREYDVTFLAAASQMLIRDGAKEADVKKLKKSQELFRNAEKFQSIRDYIKNQDAKKEKELTELKFKCIGQVPVLDHNDQPTYPPSQYKGADKYSEAIQAIREDAALDTQTRSRMYRQARKELYDSGKIEHLDESLAIKYPVFKVIA